MENISAFLSDLWFEVLNLDLTESWWQLLAILIALSIGWFISSRVSAYLGSISPSSPDRTDRTLKSFSLKTVKRLVFPISALILVLLSKVILHVSHLPAQILDIAIPLLISLASIRAAIYILQVNG